MILKIATGVGWRYFDGIDDVTTTVAKNVKDVTYDDLFLWVNTIKPNGDLKPEGSLGQTGQTVVQLLVRKHRGDRIEEKLYLADLAVYLMSDEGKTIERIN